MATPVNSMRALSGSAATLIVARAGVLPNSKCLAYTPFIAPYSTASVMNGFTKTI
jgi:hypothetical protein